MPPKKLSKTTRKITTINDVLARDDVNDILEKVNRSKADICDLIVITMPKDGGYRLWITNETLESKAVYMLEAVKMDILNGNLEEDNEQ
jgi:hypothetical protein